MDGRKLKFAILAVMARPGVRSECKQNLIGHHGCVGSVEGSLGVRFDNESRFAGYGAFDELVSAGLLRPTFTDIHHPEAWVAITDAGRLALTRRALDDLDCALSKISPTLLELRDGASAAATSTSPDAQRQAAHSARELIDQTLKLGAPDATVRGEPGFQPDPSSRDGITRRHRLRTLMLRGGGVSESSLAEAEAACELVVRVDRRRTRPTT